MENKFVWILLMSFGFVGGFGYMFLGAVTWNINLILLGMIFTMIGSFSFVYSKDLLNSLKPSSKSEEKK